MHTKEFHNCCGVLELGDFGDTTIKSFLTDFIEAETYDGSILETNSVFDGNKYVYEALGLRYAFVVFTDIQDGFGHRLAKYIKDKKWGVLTRSRAVRNPNSENKITVFTWAPNNTFFRAAKKKYEELEN